MVSEQDFWSQAGRFVEFVHREAGMPAIVCDADGVIRKAHVRSRIGDTHAGAQRILRGEVEEALVTAEEAAANPKVREGCNCPIVLGGKRVATFGIAGSLEVSQPISRMAAAVLSSWLEDAERQRLLAEAAGRVVGAVQQLSARIDTAGGAPAELTRRGQVASSAAGKKIDAAGEVIGTVAQIAQQSRILAINGSVEAARAGEQGRAFGVVAREMLGLAEDAKGASVNVAASLKDLRGAVGDLDQALRAAVQGTETDLSTLRDVLGVARSLEEALRGLTAGRAGQAAAAAGRPARAPASGPSAARPRPAASPS